MAEQNPNLMSKSAMQTMAATSGSGKLLMHEILTKVNNAKDKPKKIAVLKENDTPGLRQLLKAAFDPNITWDLPDENPPYMANEAPEGTQHTSLLDEAKRLYLYITGGSNLPKLRKETLFIQTLEGLHHSDAKALLDIKAKKLNKTYKGLTESVVKEAFDWNDNFMRK